MNLKKISLFLYRDDLDWGLYSLDTIMDRSELRNNHFLALTQYGDHALHHLFPTIDNGVLPHLYPELSKTMQEHEVELNEFPWHYHIYGQLKLLSCTETNPIDPSEKLRRKKIQRK